MERFRFSGREVKEILISMLVLSIVFAYPEFLGDPSFILISLLVVGIGFMGHELSHRFTAIRYGYWAEYKMWGQGLLFALLLAFVSGGSFIFAAPGAVVFSPYFVFKHPTREEIGKISISGSVFNISLLYVFLALNLVFPNFLFQYGALINAWLAIFNLIPFGPLDGNKVLAWDTRIWAAAFVAAIAGFGMALFL